MISWLLKQASRFRKDDQGAAFILVTLALPIIFGMAAFSVDLGYAYYVKSRLQTAADIGALAGGTLLYTGDKKAVEAKALEYVNMNLPAGWNGANARTIKITPTAATQCLKALSDQGLGCDGSSKANALKVTVAADTPLFFANVLGYTKASFSASAMVGGSGAAPPPLNIAIVLDTTASMNSTYSGSCGSLVKPTKLQCATAALRGMLGTLWPSIDQVALFTFPRVTTASIPMEYCQTSGTVTVVNYKAASAAKYKIVDFSSDYRGAGTPPPPGLLTTSNLVKAVGGKSGCAGIQSKGGVSTYFASSIAEAQAALEKANDDLVKNGGQARQNVMMILSDGDANASSTNIDSAKVANQCKQGIDAASAATDNKTWVYSVAYQADDNPGSSCTTDTSTATTTTVAVTTTTTTTPYTKTCGKNSCTGPTAGKPTSSSNTVNQPPPAPQNSTSTSTNPAVIPTCTKNCTVKWTSTTITVTSKTNTQTSTSYDRTACETMRQMASDPSKFYSVSGSGGCISDSNPNTTDLVAIFKNVAVSLMKKRRIPLNTL